MGSFEGDVYLLFRLLLCKEDKRVFRVREKGIVKCLSGLFGCSLQEMLTDLEQGDLGETAKKFFVASGLSKQKSTYTLKEVDDWLEELTNTTRDDQHTAAFKTFIERATGDDLKLICKIIDHDLKISIGARYALVALHPDAFNAYKNSNNLKAIIEKAKNYELKGDGGLKRKMSLSVNLMTPIKPMLARPNNTLEHTVQRCPNGMFAEIKYDGERVQIHKNNDEYKTYSRNLKPVAPHKIAEVQQYIPQAFTGATTIILDGEILLMDTNTNLPLPFGTLGIHKKTAFTNATVCLFIFDILYLNGEMLLGLPLCERRKILEENVKPIPGRIALSEVHRPKNVAELTAVFNKVVSENIEGLVVKDIHGTYEPNMRHWIKIKKEHFDGMCDTVDLIVLGAYYGTGNKGGLMSIFLMGVYDEKEDRFKTVCKVGNGFTDKTIQELQTAFPVVKIEKNEAKCPSWLSCKKMLLPDFVVKNPRETPIWEIKGAEFTISKFHTADSISIRFPRVIKVRDDKDWKTATSLKYLRSLYEKGGINRKKVDDEEEEENDEFNTIQPKMNSLKINTQTSQKSNTIAKKSKEDEVDGKDVFLGLNVIVYKVENEERLKGILKRGGAGLVDEDDEGFSIKNVTHIITEETNEKQLYNGVKQENPNCCVVSPLWIDACLKHNCLVSERNFLIS
uniref:DNA ligase n=1 Tax=Arcella intermedia TaxID=1963864 RepID=A0A6B2KYW2_9EUKA